MDLKRAEILQDALASIVDYPLLQESPKVKLSATLTIGSLQFAAAVRVLCGSGLLLGASATLRSQFEAIIRSVWVLYRATDNQIERLSANLSLEAQQASKNIPNTSQMIAELENISQLKNLLVALNEFKTSSWTPLNSFVHSGIHAVHWTKNGGSSQLLDTVFRSSNGLTIISFQHLGILTGRPNVQAELFAATAGFGSILPIPR